MKPDLFDRRIRHGETGLWRALGATVPGKVYGPGPTNVGVPFVWMDDKGGFRMTRKMLFWMLLTLAGLGL